MSFEDALIAPRPFSDAPSERAPAQRRARFDVSPVARTMLIPLWARATEMKKRRPLVHDPRALEICEGLDFDFSIFRRAYGTQVGCVLRGLLYDAWVCAFLARHPTGTVVELGAGLGTRFERIDNGSARWVDVDLPDAIAVRERHVTPSARRTFLRASVVDPTWPDRLRSAANGPWCFVAEGMLMYLAPEDVRALFVRLASAFGPATFVFDSVGTAVVRHQRLHDSMRHMMDAPFRWGVDDARAVESWDPRLAVRDVATLPDIARRFRSRVPLAHRLVGTCVERALPRVAGAYRVAHVEIDAEA